MSTDGPVPRPLLSVPEMWWRDHQPWLKECGYTLRARYQPDWTPSWLNKPWYRYRAEDNWSLNHFQIMDAIRVRDGARVVLKLLENKADNLDEARIWAYLTSEELASDPKNHCVPLLETLHPPDDDKRLIFVTPILRTYMSPRFDTFGEAVEFFRQIFEGIQFMHHHRVAHRDCCSRNIMMDGAHLYPKGFHPQCETMTPALRPRAEHYTRTRYPVKYCIIDFGISYMFEPGEPLRPVQPIIGVNESTPEFQGDGYLRPQDPFATDIYYLGNSIREDFLDGAPPRTPGLLGFEFMRPLVNDMVQEVPSKRPNIDEVVARFEEISGNLSSWKLRSRVVKKSDFRYHLPHIIGHWCRRVWFVMMRVLAIPRPST